MFIVYFTLFEFSGLLTMNKTKYKSCVDSQRNFNNLYISSKINFVWGKEKDKDKPISNIAAGQRTADTVSFLGFV